MQWASRMAQGGPIPPLPTSPSHSCHAPSTGSPRRHPQQLSLLRQRIKISKGNVAPALKSVWKRNGDNATRLVSSGRDKYSVRSNWTFSSSAFLFLFVLIFTNAAPPPTHSPLHPLPSPPPPPANNWFYKSLQYYFAEQVSLGLNITVTYHQYGCLLLCMDIHPCHKGQRGGTNGQGWATANYSDKLTEPQKPSVK